MSNTKTGKQFRTRKITYIDLKHIDMDRMLTKLFPLLKYSGQSNKTSGHITKLMIEECRDFFMRHPEWFVGFKHLGEEGNKIKDVVKRWIETDLMDMATKGRVERAVVAAPRPLHGNTYKFSNPAYARDYGAAEQVYWMLFFASKGRGRTVQDSLKRFFFMGIDPVTDSYDPSVTVDVETQAILRLDAMITKKESRPKPSSSEPQQLQPLCVGQADIMADDISRLLAYEDCIPRAAMVDYLKTLLAFHLALYHLKLMQILPNVVKQHSCNKLCSEGESQIKFCHDNTHEGCPYRLELVVDMGGVKNKDMMGLAEKSASRFYGKVPAFVRSNFIIKKLEEMTENQSNTSDRLPKPAGGTFTVGDLVALLHPEHEDVRESYFAERLDELIEELGFGNDDDDPKIRQIIALGLSKFDSLIEILIAKSSAEHRKSIIRCLDSLLLKNKENGLLAQTKGPKSARRFLLGSDLLEVLVQVAVLTRQKEGFATRQIRIEELLDYLRGRYGLYIDRLPENAQHESSVHDRHALRRNLDAFKLRLREIGFYKDLSDAYVNQKVSPRYKIEENDKQTRAGGMHE